MTSQSASAPVTVRAKDGITTLTMNRPDRRNALSEDMMRALLDGLESASANPDSRVVVLDATGPAYCAGHDLRELLSLDDPAKQLALFQTCGQLMLRIADIGQPVIAKVRGIATAAGCQLVAACDLAIAAASARFATPGVNIGLFCSTPSVALTRAVPAKAAMEMLLTARPIDAADAQRIGLINRMVADEALDAAVDALANDIAKQPAAVIALGKAAVRRQKDMSLRDAYAEMACVMANNLARPEAQAGIQAFLDKRPPPWSPGHG